MFHDTIDENIELRLLEEQHAEAVYGLLKQNRNHLQAELTWLTDQLTLEDARAYIRAGLDRQAANNGLRAGIWLRDELAGIASLHGVVWADRKASLGYWLGEAYQGRGLVTKACASLIRHAFEELDLNRLEIQCDRENVRSRKVAERLGFTLEGILRQAWWNQGRVADLAVYGLLKPEWHGTAN
jgi:ribosomal-protein-serine acetyltransferase